MKGWMKITIWVVLVLGVLFAFFRIFFITFYRVPDTKDPRDWANAPSLEPGDFVLVWRGEAHIGDLVQCVDPVDPTHWLIARVIAIGGDKISSHDGGLFINNFHVSVNSCLSKPRTVMTPDGQDIALTCSSEELGSSKHDYLSSPEVAPFADFAVPADSFFLLSDNRVQPWSYDSRVIGVVPTTSCERRLALRLWSKKGWFDGDRRMTFLF